MKRSFDILFGGNLFGGGVGRSEWKDIKFVESVRYIDIAKVL